MKEDKILRKRDFGEDARAEQEYCPACRKTFSPGRSCWCYEQDDESRAPRRRAA